MQRRFVYPGLLWALWVLALISGILESKPNGAPGAAPHTGFGLGIKIRMLCEYIHRNHDNGVRHFFHVLRYEFFGFVLYG